MKITNKYIRYPIGVLVALGLFLTFSVAMVIPVEYLPIDTRYDKIQHATVFFTLTYSITVCLRLNHWFIGLSLSLFAVASECVQNLLPYRSGSWEDLYADFIGIGVACLTIEILLRIYYAARNAF